VSSSAYKHEVGNEFELCIKKAKNIFTDCCQSGQQGMGLCALIQAQYYNYQNDPKGAVLQLEEAIASFFSIKHLRGVGVSQQLLSEYLFKENMRRISAKEDHFPTKLMTDLKQAYKSTLAHLATLKPMHDHLERLMIIDRV